MRYKQILILTVIISISALIFSCKKNATKSDPDPLESYFIVTNVSVFGGSDGAIDLNVTGGITPYNFHWSNGESSEDLGNLIAGKYSVIVTDSDSKTIQDSTIISEPEPIDSTIFDIPGITLFNFNRLNEKLVIAHETYNGGVNVTIFSGSEGNLIIDSGWSTQRLKLDNAIQYLNQLDLNYIINTHNHIDHLGGNGILPDGGTIIGHVNGVNDYQNSSTNPTVIGISNIYDFSYNSENIRCFPLAEWGHTNTDIAIYFEDFKVLCLGDAYLSESFPSVTTSRGARVQHAITNYETIINNFPSDITLIPGHGKRASMDDLVSYLDMVKRTVEIVRSHMDQGKSLNEIIDEEVLKNYDKWGRSLAVQGLDTNYWINAIYYSYSTDSVE